MMDAVQLKRTRMAVGFTLAVLLCGGAAAISLFGVSWPNYVVMLVLVGWLLALLAGGTYAVIYWGAFVQVMRRIGRIHRAVNRQRIGQIED